MNPSGKASDELKVVPDGGTITLGEYKRLRAEAGEMHVVRRDVLGSTGDAA